MTEEIKEILKEYSEKTKRHFDVVAEDLKGKMDTIAEQVADNTEQITSIKATLNSHTETLGSIKEDIEVIKIDIGLIKNDLKQKVDRDEFVALEKRVSMLEAKSNR